MKPLLKWPGGKARLAPQIGALLGRPRRGGRYFEPFAGSAAVYLHLVSTGRAGRGARISDLNPKVIAFHVAVRDNPEELLRELGRLPLERWRDAYADVRAAFNQGPWDGPLHAARFLWLNRCCYNGVYRENRAGHFNVPAGSYTQPALPSPEAIRDVSGALQGASVECAGFADVLGHAARGDRVYCDPPYVPLSADGFTSYGATRFGLAEQLALADLAGQAASRGARMVLSNHDTPAVRSWYSAFRLSARSVQRSVSCGARVAAREVFATAGPRGRA